MAGLDLSDDNMCFCCGRDNPDGLKLDFTFRDGRVSTTVAFPRKYQGYRGIVHGGLLSTVLDEAMVTLLNRMGHLAVTGELRVRFLSPLPVGESVDISARLVQERGRTCKVAAEARLRDGTEVARAESICLLMGPIPERAKREHT